VTHWNMEFTLFFLDSRALEDLVASLDEMVGGHFEQDIEYKADGRYRYINYVLGLNITLLREQTWDEGYVYCFTGSNDHCSRFDTLDVTDMSFHVRKLLSSLDLTRIMTFEEFREESRRRNPP
jgi:hypothetical protein